MTCSKFPKLFAGGKIGSLTLKNRILMAPMGTRFAEDGFVSKKTIAYYCERARNGVGLITTEGAEFLPTGPLMLHVHQDKFIPKLATLTKSVHKSGTPIMLQIVFPKGIKDIRNPVGPSAISVASGKTARALDRSEIKEMVTGFGLAARRAMDAGFDGVNIHGGHGALLTNFLSPLTNKRTDQYGGSLEGQARFALEIVTEVRKKTSPDFPVVFRIMADEKTDNGFNIDDAVIVSKWLTQEGIDAIDVVSGSSNEKWITPPMSMPVACNAPLSEVLKKSLNIPVIVAGKIINPYIAERVLAEGKADFVALGRSLLADPEFPQKAMDGKTEDIRTCIGCLKCRDAIGKSNPIICTVNPSVISPLSKGNSNKTSKNVLVIGAGPGGITAALRADQKGYGVTLWEIGTCLGGQLNLACLPPGKHVIKEYLDYLLTQLAKSSVKVELNKKSVDAKTINRKFDAVVVATGATPRLLKIEGENPVNRHKILTANEVLSNPVKAGGKTVVIGGGYIGCEVAELLAELEIEVTIVEVLDELVSGVLPRIREYYLEKLKEKNIRVYTGIKDEHMNDTGLEIITREGKRESILADTVVLAAGSQPNMKGVPSPKGITKPTYIIGDCSEARSLLEAVHEGAGAAARI